MVATMVKQKILVVDDDNAVRTVLKSLLEEAGYAVHLAESGEHCLGLIEHVCFDLIILDVVMPELGGIETILKLRSKRPDQKTIVISGKVPTQTAAFRRLVRNFGTRAVLQKPFDGETILAEVKSALSTDQTTDQTTE